MANAALSTPTSPQPFDSMADKPHELSDTPAPSLPATRLASLDVYRGLTMLLLAFTVPNWGWQEALAEEHSWLRGFADQVEHARWWGLTLWDMIQPSFMFMVGVALPYSYASRRRRGVSDAELWRHAAYRALMLVLLGIFLRSVDRSETFWTLEDVVSQIGLGYLPLFWLATQPHRVRVGAFVALLGAAWLLFALWPIASPLPEGAVAHFEGFAAHWNESAGPERRFDQWLLNLPPRSEPFSLNDGGYYTLNFVPSLATMVLGLIAGDRLRVGESASKLLLWLIGVGTLLLIVGLLLDWSGCCPLVKKIWTPSFGLVSGGLCLLILAALYAIVDLAGWRRWAWPAEVVGRNPLAMYIMTWTLAGWVMANLNTHLGESTFNAFGENYAPLLGNLAVGFLLWSICWWMDRNKVYVRL